MPVEDWGSPAAFADAFTGTTLNALASGNALAGLAIDNSVNLDMFADISFSLASFTPAAPFLVGISVYPRQKDASTYGDNQFGSAAAGPPPAGYFAGLVTIPSGAGVKWGMIRGIILPPGFFKFVVYNGCGATWAASGNTIQYRSYSRTIT